MYKLRYVRVKSLEWFEKNTLEKDEFYVSFGNESWGFWKKDIGKVVNIFDQEYMGVSETFTPRLGVDWTYNKLKFGIEEELTKERYPEYYL